MTNRWILKFFDWQFSRFLVIGLVNTVFGYSVFFLVSLTGIHYLIILVVSTCLGALFNFLTVSRMVFRRRENRLLPRFLIVYGIVYVLNAIAMRVMKSGISNILVVQAILALPLALVSYGLNRSFVFSRRNVAERPGTRGDDGQSG